MLVAMHVCGGACRACATTHTGGAAVGRGADLVAVLGSTGALRVDQVQDAQFPLSNQSCNSVSKKLLWIHPDLVWKKGK